MWIKTMPRIQLYILGLQEHLGTLVYQVHQVVQFYQGDLSHQAVPHVQGDPFQIIWNYYFSWKIVK